LDDLPKSNNVEDRRGDGGFGGGRGGFGIPTGRSGMGIGTIIILALIGWALGIDPFMIIGGMDQMSRTTPGLRAPNRPPTPFSA
jgi:predicted metalloprotease